jgi:CheY-like chemotaxis protein
VVWADQDRLQQVFWNLLGNAVKFTSSGGRVEVSLQHEDSDVRISIADTGCGIAPAFLPYVFERFRQADGSSTRPHGGLGLGLSIVRHLVELHGGRMSADSPGAGLGSTFTVYLPTRQPDERPPADLTLPIDRPRTRPLDLDGTHVLIVDDERDARDLLRAMLSGTGARISEADSAAEALRAHAADRADLILADVAMPVQDGYAMMRSIRSLAREGSDLRSVAISAYARREDRQRALRAGFNEHLCKPVQLDDLFDVLERVFPSETPLRESQREPRAKVH